MPAIRYTCGINHRGEVMATYLENLITRRDALHAQLATLTTARPDYNIDGQAVSGVEAKIREELDWLDAKIREQDGPYEFEIQGG